MKKILSISTLFVMGIAMFVATLGNGLVTNEVLAQKPGPSCQSFDNRNNPVKPDNSLGFDEYREICQNMGHTACGYSVGTEEIAKDFGRPFLSGCAKQNQ